MWLRIEREGGVSICGFEEGCECWWVWCRGKGMVLIRWWGGRCGLGVSSVVWCIGKIGVG